MPISFPAWEVESTGSAYFGTLRFQSSFGKDVGAKGAWLSAAGRDASNLSVNAAISMFSIKTITMVADMKFALKVVALILC